MKHILVPTDFSDNAYNALLYATRLYPNETYTITLVHSYEEEFSMSTSRIDIGRNDDLCLDIERRVSKEFEKLTHSITRDTEDIKINFETIITGFPLFKCIHKLQKEKEITLIIMGTKGASGLKEIFIGSQTIKLIKKIKKLPLLIIPNEANFIPPKVIAYATDFKESILPHEIKTLEDIIKSNNGVLKITHVYDQKSPEHIVESNYKKIKNSLSGLEHTTHWLSNTSKKEKVLDEFIKKMNVDMLVLTYHKHSLLKRLFKEDIVKNIGFHTTIPVLIFTTQD
ncbi:universal stress protein UspA [Dokdonia pacifica]|uniref:Nucleotide-binding universal stress protein, UspA family n=1 Tax=Dokdonia pacifica TaxID=1627892 RepID=A0A239BG67_9FLAO|nr:universal stress protein [Dokdonia pacifica]GGG29536.1 universal stress protein UspA [Dokdonia pacifica]SNS07055.1 Nucleotide-binding universal stress protein, UspA family [Dokdonia pacifica]